jgi:hypothetical protein
VNGVGVAEIVSEILQTWKISKFVN